MIDKFINSRFVNQAVVTSIMVCYGIFWSGQLQSVSDGDFHKYSVVHSFVSFTINKGIEIVKRKLRFFCFP